MRKEYKDRWNSKLVHGPVTLRVRQSGMGWDKWDVILCAAAMVSTYVWLIVAGINS